MGVAFSLVGLPTGRWKDIEVQEETRPGYYKDRWGHWQKDRRTQENRRGSRARSNEEERRRHIRRKSDQDLVDHEHREMIEEALEDFSVEHDKE